MAQSPMRLKNKSTHSPTKEMQNTKIPGRLPENRPPLIPITKIGIEKREKTSEQKSFLYKQFLSANYFDVIIEHTPVS